MRTGARHVGSIIVIAAAIAISWPHFEVENGIYRRMVIDAFGQRIVAKSCPEFVEFTIDDHPTPGAPPSFSLTRCGCGSIGMRWTPRDPFVYARHLSGRITLTIPLWLPVPHAFALIAIRLIRWHNAIRRWFLRKTTPSGSACAHCGYDCRLSGSRCPECGRERRLPSSAHVYVVPPHAELVRESWRVTSQSVVAHTPEEA